MLQKIVSETRKIVDRSSYLLGGLRSPEIEIDLSPAGAVVRSSVEAWSLEPEATQARLNLGCDLRVDFVPGVKS
ncbi:hypothetical protein L1887_10187 [Cichorium endivia]|nr:hypothetical protein L1887_10187 [Cichorium endivia]